VGHVQIGALQQSPGNHIIYSTNAKLKAPL